MQITRSKVSTKKILNRPMTVRILSLFFITEKLSTSDVQKVIGGALSHISEALNSLAIYSALEEGFSDNGNFKGN